MRTNENKMRSELLLASESGDVQTIQNLYREDSRVLRDVTFEGDTPLHIAARKGHLHLVRWILDRKPSLARARNKDDNTPLHEAAKSGNRDLAEILLPHKQRYVYDCNKFGGTALMIASKYGHVETVRLLLEAKSKDNAFEREAFDRDLEKIEWELSVKHAAYRGYRDIVVAMLDHPVKPMKFSLADEVLQATKELRNYCADRCREPIKLSAAYSVAHATYKLIIDNRTDRIRFKYQHTLTFRETPSQSIAKTPILHTAVQGGHLEIVVAMLNHDWWRNSSMTKKDEYGRCAIHVAAMNGRWDIINEFMSRMPHCMAIRSVDHKSVLHFAVEYNQLEVVENLLINKDAETVRELVSHDHDRFGNTALHLAVINGANTQIVEHLVSFPGVAVNAPNDEGMTAIDRASAAARHNPSCAIIVEKLKGAGGIRSRPTSDPSNYSEQGGDINRAEIASEPGVHVNAPSNEDNIPLHISSAAAEDKACCCGSICWSLMSKSSPSNDSKQEGDKDIVHSHMVVASLIATVTFAAILTIPGGIEEDDSRSIHYGAARMAFRKVFRLFLFSDTAAFTSSLTVVTGWLVRHLLPHTYLPRLSHMSHMSGLTLLASIAWTIVAFVCATIIVTIPGNFEKLESMDQKALSHYKLIRRNEILLAITPSLYVGLPLLISLLWILWKRWKSPLSRISLLRRRFYLLNMYVILCGVTYMIIIASLERK